MALRQELNDIGHSTAVIQTQFAAKHKPDSARELPGVIDYCDIIFEKALGEGAASTTHLGTYKGEQVVIKKYRYEDLSPPAISRMNKQFLQEWNTLTASFSEHTVRPVGYCQKSLSNPGVILMEYVENGSLEDYLAKYTITFSQAIDIVNDVALGILKLLDVNLVHRDIKTANILLTKELRAKICDFDVSRSKDLTSIEEAGWAGSAFNLAPEYYSYSKFYMKKDGLPAADVFSFGMVLMDIFVNHQDTVFKEYENLYGTNGITYRLNERSEPAYKIELLHKMINTTDFSIIPECWRDEVKNIIKLCIEENPQKRATMQAVQARLQNILNQLKQPQDQLVKEKANLSVTELQDKMPPEIIQALVTQSLVATKNIKNKTEKYTHHKKKDRCNFM